MPLVELALLIKIGEYIGVINTIVLVVSTGILGAILAKWQGLQIISQIRAELQIGKMPTKMMLDGLLILIGGIVLLTPGIITDILGFCMLIPLSREYLKLFILKMIKKHILNNPANKSATFDYNSINYHEKD